MRVKPLSPKQIEENFNSELQDAIDIGKGPRTDFGLDRQTMMAISAVADAFPQTDSSLIQNARKEFAKQVDGTHTAEDRAWWSAAISGRYNS